MGGLSYLAAGLVALDRRPRNAIGWLMISFGFTWYLGNWSNLNVAVVPMIGSIGPQLTGAILAQIALSYPQVPTPQAGCGRGSSGSSSA